MLTSLPPELLLNIAAYCGTCKNVAALVRTCRWTHRNLDKYLYVFEFQKELGCSDFEYSMSWAAAKPERLPTTVKWYRYIAAELKHKDGFIYFEPSAESCAMAAALPVAVEAGNDAAANWLLDHDAPTEIPNQNGWTPLMLSLRNKNIILAKRLIEHGAEISVGILYSATPIKLACQLGDCAAEVVDLMLERGAEDYPGSPWRHTIFATGALNAAASAGSIRLVRLFIDRGVDIDRHLVHESVMRDMPKVMDTRQYDTIAFLLKRGYYPDWDSERGQQLAEEFCIDGNLDYMRCFFQHTTLSPEFNCHRFGPMLHCNLEMGGSISVTRFLIEQGADVNSRGRDNMTALARAIKLFSYPKHHNQRFHLLMAAGADVNQCFDAVKLAVSPPFSECLAVLLRAGADLSRRTTTQQHVGTTLLMHAVSMMSDVSIIKKILKNCPEALEMESEDGRRALEYAIASGHDVAVRVLLARGASIRRKTKLGLSMLSLAAQSSTMKCIAVLISYGANVNTRDENDDGWYPLMHAVQADNAGLVAYLLSRGADPSLCDHHGKDVEHLLRGLDVGADLKQVFNMANARKGDGILDHFKALAERLAEEVMRFIECFLLVAASWMVYSALHVIYTAL